ncbi:ceramide transfer protein [Planococcus citri]|uniref:ceramide transfer protein n=1 Tax=Planococcus citri TaxID=170843 RepID=UPI0031F7BB66
MAENMASTVSDEEEDIDMKIKYPELQGYLNKWTNYIHGWQKRWIVLKNGALSYYKTQNEAECGCRGAISLLKAYIKAHEFDPCRFDVAVNDCAWYLRADTPEEKEQWLQALTASKQRADSGYNSENNLIRHGSTASLQSNTLSTGSSNSSLTFQKSSELKSKLTEIDTLKDSLCRQVDNLQQHFEKRFVPSNDGKDKELVDFKVDVMTCKATVHNISEVLHNCINLISLQEDSFVKCIEQETEKRQQMEEMHRNHVTSKNPAPVAESEIRAAHEDEFYDAVEPSLESSDNKMSTKPDENENDTLVQINRLEHRLSAEIDKITTQQVQYARMGIGRDAWQLFAEEGEMKMYRREEEVNGLVIDPLKACHFVNGFTAYEICNYFFKPEFRYEWETTLEANGMEVLEMLSDDTLIFHQIHKRVWPTTQRDAVFWSHMRQVPKDEQDDQSVYDSWVVVNHSTDVKSHPPNSGKFVRIFMTVCLMCQTIILNPSKDVSQLNRNEIACKITYCSVVNPGGWVPSSGLRMVYKREYPRFLRKFTAYVTDKTKGKPISF